MRRATNNKYGQWVEVVFKIPNSKKLCTGVFVGYVLKRNVLTARLCSPSPEKGELRSTNLKPLSTTPIEPPMWDANMWDIWADAHKIGHYALLLMVDIKSL